MKAKEIARARYAIKLARDLVITQKLSLDRQILHLKRIACGAQNGDHEKVSNSLPEMHMQLSEAESNLLTALSRLRFIEMQDESATQSEEG